MQYDTVDKVRTKMINAEDNLGGSVFQNVYKTKYLGVTITEDLRWNAHVSYICTKANRTLVFLR